MGFLRLLVYVVFALVAARVVRALLRAALVRRPSADPGSRSASAGPPPPPRSAPAERLVLDPVCGVRLPEGRAIREGDRYYCSEACRAKGAAAS